MGFTRFPKEKRKKQLKQVQPCCKNNLKKWDCYCSWGCPMCWIAWKCDVCDASYDHKIGEEIRDNGSNEESDSQDRG